MELSSIEHIDSGNLSDIEVDVFITSLSHEERTCHIARTSESLSCRRVVLEKKHPHREFSYNQNMDYFRERKYEFHLVSGKAPNLEQLFEPEEGKEELSLLIDCTSMPQQWYYAILNWFAENEDLLKVRMRITYTMAGFVDEGQSLKVRGVKDFIRVGAPKKKQFQALILGLGQESKVSEDILKRIKPDLLYLFYTDPAVEKRFVEQLFVNNHAVIERTPIRNLIPYPVHNAQNIYQILSNTILPLRDDYNITVIPRGPKIFSMVSMLVQLGYPEINLSYPVFKRGNFQDRKTSGEPVIIDISFEGEE